MAKRIKDEFNKDWIISNSIEIIEDYEDGVLTLRGLHYKLVSRGMTNTTIHYKRVVTSLISARNDGIIRYEVFSDRDRNMEGNTPSEITDLDNKIEQGKNQIGLWARNYSKNKWENQTYFPVVLIEKKALIGVFEPVCNEEEVMFGACKGYPSLTFLNELAEKLNEASLSGKIPLILYFGDYDPSGEDIPRSIEANFKEKFNVYGLELKRILLMEDQVIKHDLPPAPIKPGDSRSANWEGLGQVELDALEPSIIQNYCRKAIRKHFNNDLHSILLDEEEEEKKEYRKQLKEYVINITD